MVANICYHYYRKIGAYYSGSKNSFQSYKAKGKVLMTEDQERPHLWDMCPYPFALRRKPFCFPSSILHLELFCLGGFSIKVKRQRAKNCLHYIIYLPSLPYFALSKWIFSSAATAGMTLLCCIQSGISYFLFCGFVYYAAFYVLIAWPVWSIDILIA